MNIVNRFQWEKFVFFKTLDIYTSPVDNIQYIYIYQMRFSVASTVFQVCSDEITPLISDSIFV